jgi:geranylgeranyl diphosphate synthase, type II
VTSLHPSEDDLLQYRALTRDALQRTLDRARLAPYLDDVVREYPLRGGKAIRPALLLATTQAFGGRLSDALGTAAALELLHNAFLIHDDIADGSAVRRGRPTLHRMYGVGLALIAGNALASVALESLLDDESVDRALLGPLVDEMLTLIRQTIEGQGLELRWRRDMAVGLTTADYFVLAGKKTCWYTTVAPLRLGALLAAGDDIGLEPLSRLGFYLGLAFQIRDDLLDLESRAGVLGKDARSDLRERKRTLMALHLLDAASGDDRDRVLHWLTGVGRASGHEAALLLDLMHRYGSVEVAREQAQALTDVAVDAFEEVFADVPDSEHVAFLRRLTRYMLARQW